MPPRAGPSASAGDGDPSAEGTAPQGELYGPLNKRRDVVDAGAEVWEGGGRPGIASASADLPMSAPDTAHPLISAPEIVPGTLAGSLSDSAGGPAGHVPELHRSWCVSCLVETTQAVFAGDVERLPDLGLCLLSLARKLPLILGAHIRCTRDEMWGLEGPKQVSRLLPLGEGHGRRPWPTLVSGIIFPSSTTLSGS